MAYEEPAPAPSPFAEFSRRVLLTRGGTLATGAGAALVGAVAIGATARRDDGQPPAADATPTGETAYNVRQFGAKGDGDADDTAALQAAIDAAKKLGGTVFLPPGVYLTGRLVLHSRIHLRGSGGGATVLRLKPGANSALLESAGFATLTGRGGDGGITMFSVRDLTLDGNKAHNERAGYGMRFYAYGYELASVIIVNFRNDGIYSEWGLSGALPVPSHQMEAHISGITSSDNDGYGVNFNGPHDSMLLNCVAAGNGAAGFRLATNSAGTSLVNSRAAGDRQNIGFDLAANNLSCMNCDAEINGGVGVRIARNDCRWFGGLVSGANHHQPDREIGVQFVPGAQPAEPAGSVVDTKILNCGTAAVDFGADRGLSTVRAVVSQPGVLDGNGQPVAGSGRGWIGTPAATTRVEITSGLADPAKNLVVRPAFDLRAQPTPPPPGDGSVRLFARQQGGKTQLCAVFPGGVIRVMATEPD